MAPNLQDPKITAYILNELSPNEKKEFETRMQNDPELKRIVDDLTQTTQVLSSELSKESVAKFEIVSPAESSQSEPKILVEKSKGRNWFKVFGWSGLSLAVTAMAVYLLVPRYLLTDGGQTVVPDLANIERVAEEKKPTVAESKENSSPSDRSTVAKTEVKQGRRISPIGGNQPSAPAPKADIAMSPASKRTTIDFRNESIRGRMQKPQGQTLLRSSPMIDGYSGGVARKFKKRMGPAGSGARPNKPPASLMEFEAQDDLDTGDYDKNTEEYDHITENAFKKVMDHPLSTFSIDVDTASYANMRRYIQSGSLPPKDAVRIEEMVNYFNYDYTAPKGDKPFSVNLDMVKSPWTTENHILRIGLQGKEVQWNSKGSNLVFLLDVSGSMNSRDKLPLVKQALRLLIHNLTGDDRIAIVVYAGSSGLVLPSTTGKDKAKILRALDQLSAGGSTNGGAGIELAYKVAMENFIKGGVNRVILATDGDFNVGVSDKGSLVRMIQEKAKSKVFLSVLGFGRGNLADARMESLANKGNGNYAYIDSVKEAQKVLVEQMGGTLVTIAKDVKLQIEFNPGKVAGYRLIGYENRMLAKEDFNDDKKDAGELGSGHRVTALYEIIPAGKKVPGSVDQLKYQKPSATKKEASVDSNEWLTVKLRYKKPEGDKSTLIEVPFKGEVADFANAKPDFKFASAVAGFGMILRGSKFKGTANLGAVEEWAIEGKGADARGYRQEFIDLVRKAKSINSSL